MNKLPRPIELACLALGGLLLLVSLAGIILALLSSPPSWFFMGFEFVNAFAAVMLMLLGLGRFRSGIAMALLCVAGAVGAGSALGHVGAAGQVYGIGLLPITAAKGLLAGGLTLLAAAFVLMQDRSKTFPLLIRGVLWGAPLVVLAVLWRLNIIQNLMNSLQNASTALGVIGWLMLLIVVVILICGCGHYLINAFIAGTQAGDRNASTSTTPQEAGDKPTLAPPAT